MEWHGQQEWIYASHWASGSHNINRFNCSVRRSFKLFKASLAYVPTQTRGCVFGPSAWRAVGTLFGGASL